VSSDPHENIDTQEKVENPRANDGINPAVYHLLAAICVVYSNPQQETECNQHYIDEKFYVNERNNSWGKPNLFFMWLKFSIQPVKVN